ncbi:MAG: hypothetical protein WCL27_02365 [Betaproteobacteria bacterium]
MRDNDAAVVAMICVGVIAFVVWQFSTMFGLDMATGFSVLVRLGGFVLLVMGCFWLRDSYEVTFGQLWPILLAIFWVCWWPALDHWATKDIPSFASYEFGQTILWWNSMYTKLGVLFGLIVLGYAANRFIDD